MSDHVLTNLNQLSRRVANLEALETPLTNISTRAFDSSNTSIAHNTTTILTFNSEKWDTAGMHSTAANTSRLTAIYAGLYDIKANVRWAANGTGTRRTSIIRNGTGAIARQENGAKTGAGMRQIASTQWQMSTGDYVEVEVYQDSGGALNILATSHFSPHFMMTRIP